MIRDGMLMGQSAKRTASNNMVSRVGGFIEQRDRIVILDSIESSSSTKKEKKKATAKGGICGMGLSPLNELNDRRRANYYVAHTGLHIPLKILLRLLSMIH